MHKHTTKPQKILENFFFNLVGDVRALNKCMYTEKSEIDLSNN